jgi:hypothetical protein
MSSSNVVPFPAVDATGRIRGPSSSHLPISFLLGTSTILDIVNDPYGSSSSCFGSASASVINTQASAAAHGITPRSQLHLLEAEVACCGSPNSSSIRPPVCSAPLTSQQLLQRAEAALDSAREAQTHLFEELQHWQHWQLERQQQSIQ